jgi:beta-glucosidase/6-phospho-beta-glucosidase/beta-galactosidase
MTTVSKQEGESQSNQRQCKVAEQGLSILIKKVYNRYQVCGIHKVTVTETKEVHQFKEDLTAEYNGLI